MNQVRRYVLAYLARKITVGDFLDWLADATSPVVHLNLSQYEQSVANEIELRAAELTSGHISEERFMAFLSEICT